MGKPLPSGGGDSTRPPQGDRANAVVSGAFTAAGQVSQPFPFYGAFNVVMYGVATVTLITKAASAVATVSDTGSMVAGLSAGNGVNAASIVPAGAVIASLTTAHVGGMTTVTLGGLTTTQIAGLTVASVSAAITGIGITPTATVVLERSFDGGATWVPCGVGGLGQAAVYDFGSSGIDNPVSVVLAEPEMVVNYRLNCTAFSGVVPLNYRVSTTGGAAVSWAVNVG